MATSSRNQGEGPSGSKRAKLISTTEEATSVFSLVPEIDDFQLEFRIFQFTGGREAINGENIRCYKSPVTEFKGLKWFIIIVPTRVNTLSPFNYKCILFVDNTTTNVLDTYLWIDTSTQIDDRLGETEKKKCMVEMLYSTAGEISEVAWWWGWDRPINFITADGCIKVLIKFLHPYDGEKLGLFTSEGIRIFSQIEDEIKAIQLIKDRLGKLDEKDFDFWIETKNGTKVGFHKLILEIRGGDFFKSMLSHDMLETQTGQMKLEHLDEEIVFGFKSYLYTGKIPNLFGKAKEYFEFGAMYDVQLLKDLAELELCKQIGEDKIKDLELRQIVEYHQTNYLQDENIDISS